MTCVLPPSFVEHTAFGKLKEERERIEEIGWD
jgi:hypothetical protein